MLSDKSLEEAGYKRFGGRTFDIEQYFYQKTIYDNKGNKLYFINAKKYSRNWEMMVQYNGHSDKGHTFNVDLFGDRIKSVKEMEAFFEKMYRVMGCEPYERVGE